MSTEIELARSDRQPVAAPDALDTLMRYTQAIEVAYQFAEKVCGTTLVPKAYQSTDRENKAPNAAVAILHGAELGLNPIQSLQQIFSVHGTPSIYAKTMVGLLKSKGYKFKTIEAGPTKATVSGWWPGEEPETSTWTIERAVEAGFVPTLDPQTGKYKTKKYSGPNGPYEKLIGNEKYITQPEEMLWAKAASTVCRRLAPDVLLGISHTVEDIESEPEPVRVESERVDKPAPSAAAVLAVAVDEQPDGLDSVLADDPGQGKTDVGEAAGEDQTPEPMSSRRQQERLRDLLDAAGVTDKAEKHAYLSDQFGRKITGANQLTATEAEQLIAYLEEPIEPDTAAEATDARALVDPEATKERQSDYALGWPAPGPQDAEGEQ
ncbi:hypothetical protein [Nocardia brasiliensis]|uniref:hypothetical protein n=1 Tax=Nocardia brasiliensis TaxID=37326 RepID=UPI0033E25563